MANILIADDEKEIIILLKLYLENDNVKVFEACDGESAYRILQEQRIDLALVDIMMPNMNGLELIKKVRLDMDIPIMILSARTELNDRVLGLDIGADDYITKPFEPLEVAAKVRSSLRRVAKAEDVDELQVSHLLLDMKACMLYVNDTEIPLTKGEYLVLKLFMKSPGRVFTKEQIYEAGWGYEYAVDDNTIRVMMNRLRAKVGEGMIQNVRGLGYRMVRHG